MSENSKPTLTDTIKTVLTNSYASNLSYNKNHLNTRKVELVVNPCFKTAIANLKEDIYYSLEYLLPPITVNKTEPKHDGIQITAVGVIKDSHRLHYSLAKNSMDGAFALKHAFENLYADKTLLVKNNQIMLNAIKANQSSIVAKTYSDSLVLESEEKYSQAMYNVKDLMTKTNGKNPSPLKIYHIPASICFTGLYSNATLSTDNTAITDYLKDFKKHSYTYLENLCQILKKSPLDIDLAINLSAKQVSVEGYINNCYAYKRVIDSNESLSYMSKLIDLITKDSPIKNKKDLTFTIHNSHSLINTIEDFLNNTSKNVLPIITINPNDELELSFIADSADKIFNITLALNWKSINTSSNKAILENLKNSDVIYTHVETKIDDIGEVSKVIVVNKKNNANKLIFIGTNKTYSTSLRGSLPSQYIDEVLTVGPLAWNILYNLHKVQKATLLFVKIDPNDDNYLTCKGIKIDNSFYLFYDYACVWNAVQDDMNGVEVAPSKKVHRFTSIKNFPATGIKGHYYVCTEDAQQYEWDGKLYQISKTVRYA